MNDRFEERAPSPQNVVDLFKGEWSSRAPTEADFVTEPGSAQLFEDARIIWANEQLGSFGGKTILELGPLEAAHSFMLSRLGASSVVAIENNSRAFLKCLCTKELLGVERVRFLYGDFCSYVKDTSQHFDCVVACGVLYHMTDPAKLLTDISRVADSIFIWTHYLDWSVIEERHDAGLFKQIDRPNNFHGTYDAMARIYPDAAVNWQGFCGGQHEYAVWLSKDTIVELLKKLGFSNITIAFDDLAHANGPAFALCARKT